ncbi:MAG: S41 family peptidase [Pyrinomonadaceae bacterium]
MRLLLSAFFIVLSIAAGSIAQTSYAPPKMSAEQVAADIRLLVDALESIHPGLDRYDTKTDRDIAVEALRRLAKTGGNEFELYLALSRYLAAIRCDHTKAELSPAISKHREDHPSHLPFKFTVIDGRMFVRDFDARQGSIPRGTEILRINGRQASDLIDEFARYVSVDGYTDHVRPFKLADDSDLLGSNFDQFYPLRYGFRPELALEIRQPGAKVEKKAASLISYKKWRSLGDGKAVNNFSDPGAVEFRQTGGDTAYLRVATFINYRTPIDPNKVFSPIFDQIRERKIRHLIVDLRENGGGSDDVGVALGRFLLPERVIIKGALAVKALSVKPELRPFLETWNRSVFDIDPAGFAKNASGLFEKQSAPVDLEPLANAFAGRVTFLTSASNASGVVILMARLRNVRPIRLVGEETGGSSEGPTAGVILFLNLPNSKIKVRIPVYRSFTGVKNFIPGKGLVPDVLVRATIEDLISGRDRALESALTDQ